jgi:cyclohexanone monooxygenase
MGDLQEQTGEVDVVVVGAGFAGLYMLHRLRGLGLSVQVLEAGSDVGGTWFWNRYPGARCDVESMAYSYQFDEDLQQEWEWSERYASQPEILRYINHVTERFELRDGIRFDTRVSSAVFDEEASRWSIATEAGDTLSAQFCVLATGCLSSQNRPDFAGVEKFEGPTYHTGTWPHEGVDFSGKRVAIIGTGSSAVQSIPIIAEECEHLIVFQRQPNYSVPAHNAEMDPAVEAEVKAEYAEFRQRSKEFGFGIDFGETGGLGAEKTVEEREQRYQARWQKGGLGFLGSFEDLIFDEEVNESAATFVRDRIREVVKDPKVAAVLCPESTIGCKRLCLDTHYYETFNRDNVTLVDISDSGIEGMIETGVLARGEEFEVDCIVFATGFDAMTGAVTRIDIRGRGGVTIQEKWAAGPRTYLGLSTAGFPNLFTITGPGSPSVLTNMLPSIEQHVNWIADCIGYLRENGIASIDPTKEAEDAWVDHVNEVAGGTLLLTCNSWYLGANVPGKPRVFMPYLGFPPYVEKCDEVAAKGYEGFALV